MATEIKIAQEAYAIASKGKLAGVKEALDGFLTTN